MQQAAAHSLLAFRGRCMDIKFDIANSNYKPLDKIGTGAYGVVCSALNKRNGEKVAIKKIPNSFDELTTAKRTFRELKILRHFKHENIITIREILMPKEPLSEMKDVYVVFDLMESDLHQIIHSNQPFSLEHIRFFLYQILRGLKYIHSADVIHRDLKPSNLLVNENCELKIGDFGMARGLSTVSKDKKRVFMTSYVATRWYRAPELLFSLDDYSMAVDVWSVGCILGEMIGRKQMFPGKNPIDQLALIVDLMGMPPQNMLEQTSYQLYNFFQKSFANKTAKDLTERYPKGDRQALDLLAKMLIFEPSERITVEKALQHPFLSTYYSPDDEPECFPKFDFSFENVEMSREQIKQQVGKMILKYNKPKGWTGKGLLSVVPKTPSEQTQPTPNHGSLRTVGPSSNLGTLQTVGSSSKNRGTLQVVGPSSNKNKLQTVGPGSNRTQLQTIGRSSNTNAEATQNIERKEKEEEIVSASSGSPLISENLLSGLGSPSLMFGGTEDTSPKFIAADDSGHDIFKPSTDSSSSIQFDKFDKKPKVEAAFPINPFLGLPVMPSFPANPSDVEMLSAKSTSGDSVSSYLISPGKLPLQTKNDGQVASFLVSSDIEMKSAKSDGAPLIPPQAPEDDDSKPTPSVDVKENTPASTTIEAEGQRDRSNSSGQKTISEDTKALIKAALMNSALKNQKKDRHDSTSSEPVKGGGKMPVTALSRQREREEKRKQKLRKSKNKKKSQKSKKEKASFTPLLTDEDKNMLARWNRMQQAEAKMVKEKEEAANRLESDSSVQFGATAAPVKSEQSSIRDPKQVDVDQFPSAFNPGGTRNPRKAQRSPIVLDESPKFDATPDLDSGSFFNQIQSLSPEGYPQSPDFLSQLDLPSGNSLFASFTMNGSSSSGRMGLGGETSPQGLLFESTLPQTSPTSPFMPMFVSTSSRNRSDSDVFRSPSPRSPKQQQLLYRSPADRQTPSPPTHIPSPPSCLQRSPPDYNAAAAAKNSQTNHVGPAPIPLPTLNPRPSSQDPHLLRRQRDTMSSDISTIIRQLSRSGVEDSLSSILSVPLPVTPKGDGGGYGLSLDLEEFMSETLGPEATVPDSLMPSAKCDSAPLSASLLSDWLDVRNLDAEDMKAIEQDISNLTSENLRDFQRELGLTSPMGIPAIPQLHTAKTTKNP